MSKTIQFQIIFKNKPKSLNTKTLMILKCDMYIVISVRGKFFHLLSPHFQAQVNSRIQVSFDTYKDFSLIIQFFWHFQKGHTVWGHC